MQDLDTLDTAANDEGGVYFTPVNPGTLEPLNMRIKLRSSNCESVRAKSRAFVRKLQTSTEFRKNGAIDVEQAEAQATEKLVACTVGWEGVKYHDITVCTAENARRLYTAPGLAWLRAQVLEFIEDQANFLPKAGPASTATPNGDSASAAPSTLKAIPAAA